MDCGDKNLWRDYPQSFAELQIALNEEGYSDITDIHRRIEALVAANRPDDIEEREELENLCIEYDRWRSAYDSVLRWIEDNGFVDEKKCVDVGRLQYEIGKKKESSSKFFLEQILEAYERLRPQDEPSRAESVMFTGFQDAGYESEGQVQQELISIQDQISRARAKKPLERLLKKKEKLKQLLEDYQIWNCHHCIGLDGITPIVLDEKTEDIAPFAEVESAMDHAVEAAKQNFESTRLTWPNCAARSLVLLYEHFRYLYGRAARPPQPETSGIELLHPGEVIGLCKQAQAELRAEELYGVTVQENDSSMQRAIVKLSTTQLKKACVELLECVESCCGMCDEYGSACSETRDEFYVELKALRKLCTDAAHNPKSVSEVCCN